MIFYATQKMVFPKRITDMAAEARKTAFASLGAMKSALEVKFGPITKHDFDLVMTAACEQPTDRLALKAIIC